MGQTQASGFPTSNPREVRPNLRSRPVPYQYSPVPNAAMAPAMEEGASPFQSLACYAAFCMIVVRCGVLPEISVNLLHVNTYLLYIVGPPAILGCLLTGGLGRAFRSSPVRLFLGFFLCMLLATPGSSWPGASASKDLDYLRADLICMFVVAGLIVTWKQVLGAMKAMALSGFIILMVARVFAKPDDNGRLYLDLGFDGVISNSNDLAAHVILLLPYILFSALKPRRNNLLRVLVLGCVCYGCWVILGTSSRGTMLGLVAISLFLFFRASGTQRIAVIGLVPVLALGLVAVLPKSNLVRLSTVFGGRVEQTGDDEASESMDSRQYLVMQSIKLTFQHPIFGIGPSQFANVEGKQAKARGENGNWHETHNTYTQVSSECGIPALLLFLAAFASVFSKVNQTYKSARNAGNNEVAQVCLWYLASVIGYMVSIMFLACAYRFTLPLLIGLGVAINFGARRQLATLSLQPGVPAR